MQADELIDRLMGLHAAASPGFSKDGTRLFHLADDSGQMQIWSYELGTGARRQLTFFDEPVGFFARSPADDTLILGVDCGGDERQQLHLLAPGAEAPVALTASPDVIHTWGAFAPDGTRIAFTANSRDGLAFDLYVMHLGDKRVVRLVELAGLNTVMAWSPDGTTIAVREERASSDHSLRLIDAATGTARLVEQPDGRASYSALRWRKDGGGAYCLSECGADFIGLAKLDPASGSITSVFVPGDGDVEAAALAPDASRLAVLVNRQGWSQLLLVDAATGAAKPVALPEGVLEGVTWSPDSASLAFVLAAPDQPRMLCLHHIDTGTTKDLVASDPTALGLVRWRLVSLPSFDGRAVTAWFAEPPGAAPEGGRKSVVFVHGGPESQTRPVFRADWQALVLSGYAVLFPNVRGSTGNGRHFASLDDVEKRLDSVEDLRHVHRWLAAQPGIDPQSIAIMGQSYGGFMVLAALTFQPELWHVGIDYYGFGDFLTLLRDTGPWRWRHRAAEYGDPERDRDFLISASPLGRIDKLEAPLLVAHGRRDPRVPFSESEAVVAALETRGRAVETVFFEHEGHGFTRPADRRRVYLAMLDFLKRRL